MNKAKRTALALSFVGLVAACEGEGTASLPRGADTGPLPLKDALLYLAHDDGEPLAVLVDVAARTPRVKIEALAGGELRAFVRPQAEGSEALVLTTGTPSRLEDGEPIPAVDAELSLFTRAGRSQRYQLPGRFEELALSEDGRFALVHARESDKFDPGRALAVVDLQKPASDDRAAQLVNPDNAAAIAPESFAFAPSTSARRLAAGFSTNQVMLFDLLRPELTAITASLTLSGDAQVVTPHEGIFSGDQLYVRASGTSFVYVFRMVENRAKPLGFEVTPHQLPLGTDVLDIAVVGSGESERLVALGHNSLRMFDKLGVDVPVESPEGRYTTILPFEGAAPFDEEEAPRLLLFGEEQTRLAFVDMNESAIAQEAALLELGEPVASVRLLPARKMAVVTHTTGRLSLVHLERRTVAKVPTGDAPQSTLIDETRARLWVTTQSGEVGSIDLESLSGAEILLDAYAENVVLVPGKRARVAVIHGADSGHLTLLDALEPSRETARELAGFLWSGLFD
jgi:hypothetical protein